MPEIYNMVKKGTASLYPQNLHLIAEDSTAEYCYFVNAADNTQLIKMLMSDRTTEVITTRSKAIARMFHSWSENKIYFCDCEYDNTISYIWEISLTDDLPVEITSKPCDIYDLWIYDSELYILYFIDGYTLETSNIDANGDVTTQWTQSSPPAAHYLHIDMTPEGDNISTTTSSKTDTFNMDDLDLSGYDSYDGGAGEQVYQITCYLYSKKTDLLHTVPITISGDQTGMTATTIEPNFNSYSWKTVVWSGLSLTNAELNALKMSVVSYASMTGTVYIDAMYLKIDFYGDVSNAILTIENLDTPATYEQDMGASAGRSWDISQVCNISDQFWFLFSWSNDTVGIWNYDISGAAFTEAYADCGATTELPEVVQGAISADNTPDYLYFVLGTGTKETSTVACTAGATISDSDYFKFYVIELDAENVRSEKSYYCWYDVSGSAVDPAPSGLTGIEVAILAGDTNEQVATKTKTAMDAVLTLATVDRTTNTLTITNHYNGSVSNTADGAAPNATGFTINTTIAGVDNSYALNVYSTVSDSLESKGTYNTCLMLNRNSLSTTVPECYALEKAYHKTELRYYQIARSRGALSYLGSFYIAYPLATYPNALIICITNFYMFIYDGTNYYLWKFEDVMSTCVIECLIDAEERTWTSIDLKWLSRGADYQDPPQRDQLIQVFGRYSSFTLGP